MGRWGGGGGKNGGGEARTRSDFQNDSFLRALPCALNILRHVIAENIHRRGLRMRAWGEAMCCLFTPLPFLLFPRALSNPFHRPNPHFLLPSLPPSPHSQTPSTPAVLRVAANPRNNMNICSSPLLLTLPPSLPQSLPPPLPPPLPSLPRHTQTQTPSTPAALRVAVNPRNNMDMPPGNEREQQHKNRLRYS